VGFGGSGGASGSGGTGAGTGGTGGSGGTGPGTGGSGGSGGTGGSGGVQCGTLTVTEGAGINSAHAHSLTIPAAHIIEGVQRTYTISGTHTHTVLLSSVRFANLRAGITLVISSSNEPGHSHEVTLKC
jgi:hypothetical protein